MTKLNCQLGAGSVNLVMVPTLLIPTTWFPSHPGLVILISYFKIPISYFFFFFLISYFLSFLISYFLFPISYFLFLIFYFLFLIPRSLVSPPVARSVSLPPRSTLLLTSKKSNVCFTLCKISRFP